MPLSKDQITTLLNLVFQTEPDASDCDQCFRDLSVFAEAELAGFEITEALQAVETHLRQCPCCQDEYGSLRDALHAMNEV